MPRQERDSALFVRFESRSIVNKAKSEGEKIVDNENKVVFEIKGAGRPVHEMIDYILIQIPGDKDCVPHRPVTFCGGLAKDATAESIKEECRAPKDQNGRPRLSECDVHRFPDEWARFRSGQAQNVGGTALRDLPGIDEATIDDLAYFKITTVEALAALNDSNAGPFFDLRQRAKDWLKKADALTAQAELEAAKTREQELLARITALEGKAAAGVKEKR